VLILWDMDADVIHVHHTYRVKDALPIQHADAMKRVGGCGAGGMAERRQHAPRRR
jgi:hypothetical protein